MIERQSRNVEWAIIDKGPFQLHPSLNHFILPAEVWLSMEANEKESYIKRVMSSSVTDTVSEDYQETACFPNKLIPEGIPTEPFPDDISTEPIPDDFPTEFDQVHFLSPLDVLANAALSDSVQDTTGARVSNMSLTFSEFHVYLHG